MSNREIPIEPDAICDVCGRVGAYDIMGDYYCDECIKAFTKVDKTDWDDASFTAWRKSKNE